VNIPVNNLLLRRVKPTITQTRLTREQRAANVSDAFAYVGAGRLQGQKIILLDDVFTTGTTLSECARTLKRKGGASEVHAITVTRALRG